MIIGLCGLAGSGKDTVADFLVKDHGFVKVALADPLKRICKEVFDFTDEQLWGPSEKRNAADRRYNRGLPRPPEGMEYKETDGFLTPRYALQQLGTEWGRNCYPNVWVDYALRIAKLLMDDEERDYLYTAQAGIHDPQPRHSRRGGTYDRPYKGVVISDVRFLNEVTAIKETGGLIWKIDRAGAGLSGAAAQHASETEQLKIPMAAFNAVITNDGTLDDLRRDTKVMYETVRSLIE